MLATPPPTSDTDYQSTSSDQEEEGLQSKQTKQSVSTSAQDELEQYLSEPPVDNIAYKTDRIGWWRDVGALRFPRLSYTAVDFLTIASSSAETERDFCSSRRMVTPLRCRLGRRIVGMAQCLRSWRKTGIYQPPTSGTFGGR